MNILAFESSCDETAAAVVRDGRTVLADAIASQVEMHTIYGPARTDVAVPLAPGEIPPPSLFL